MFSAALGRGGAMLSACFLGVVMAATTLCATGAKQVFSGTTMRSEPGAVAPAELARDTDRAPTPGESDTPFDDGEQTTDPSESSRDGEERPESSDGETLFADGRSVAALMNPDARKAGVSSRPPIRQAALMSQFRPDGLDRPPRA